MGRSRKLGLLGFGTSLVLGAGCISALGDFDAGGVTPGGDSGAPDTGAPLADAGLDADADLDAAEAPDATPPPTLACDTWRFPTPIVLEDLSRQNQTSFGNRMTVFTPAVGTSRVVIGKNDGTLFTVYTVDDATQKVTTLLGPTNTGNSPSLDTIRRVSLGLFDKDTQLLVRTSSPTGAPGNGYDVYLLPDGMSASGPLPPPQTLVKPSATFSNTRELRAWPYGGTDFFLALAYVDPQTSNVTFGVGRAPDNQNPVSTFATVGTSVHKNDFQSPVLLDANAKMYMFTGNDETVLGVSAFAVPESAKLSGPVTPRAISSGKLSTIFDAVVNSTPTSANVAYAEGEVGQATFKSITLRVGTVRFDKLDTFVGSDLPIARKYSDLTVSPFGDGDNPQWRGDDLVTIGQGFPLADGGATPGFNFLWIDEQGNVRSEQGGAKALLRDRVGLRRASAAPAVLSANAASWNVAWVESRTVGTSTYEVLLYNQLRCQ
jgi:hypothetical protein